MTEEEWLTSNDPINVLVALSGEGHERKFRLFACACCRRLRHLLADESRHAIQVTERYADGDATADDLLRACLGAYPVDNLVHRLAISDDQFDVLEVTAHAAEWAGCTSGPVTSGGDGTRRSDSDRS